MNLGELRRNYQRGGLRRDDLRDDPTAQFLHWLEEAGEAGVIEPNAMVLSTCPANGQPTQRTVLAKNVDENGFVFFTNFGSRKAKEIEENAQVSLLFPWLLLERQVMITGTATRVPASESLKYFVTRPLESRLGAWASEQSTPVSSRALLEAKFAEMKAKFKDGDVPLPSFWGGYRVAPKTIEFWQGGEGRLHDRFQYSKVNEGWEVERLAP